MKWNDWLSINGYTKRWDNLGWGLLSKPNFMGAPHSCPYKCPPSGQTAIQYFWKSGRLCLKCGLWLNTPQVGLILFWNFQNQESEPQLHTAKTIMSTCPLPHCLTPQCKGFVMRVISYCLIVSLSHCLIVSFWHLEQNMEWPQESAFVLLVGIHHCGRMITCGADSKQ
jgi:hypothetical protein